METTEQKNAEKLDTQRTWNLLLAKMHRVQKELTDAIPEALSLGDTSGVTSLASMLMQIESLTKLLEMRKNGMDFLSNIFKIGE